MDGLESRTISSTESGVGPFFSPDGQWIGFSAGGKLKKVSLSGGTPVDLADVLGGVGIAGASWGNLGRIAFAPPNVHFIQQVSDAGGIVQPLTRLEKADFYHWFPELLPNGMGLLFSVGPDLGTLRIVVQSLKTGERRDLGMAGFLARYAPSGHIVFMQGANLMAAVRSEAAGGHWDSRPGHRGCSAAAV